MSAAPSVTDQSQWYASVPRSIAKHTFYGSLLLVLTFGGFGVWAFSAPLAAAVISQGTFVATGQNKIVQHLEGGIIKELLISEGDEVEAGQALFVGIGADEVFGGAEGGSDKEGLAAGSGAGVKDAFAGLGGE